MKGKVHILCSGCEDKGKMRIKGLPSGRQPRNIHPRPEARAHRNGRLSRPAEGWKETFKKVLDSAEALR